VHGFSQVTGNTSVLGSVQFVITLDTDTQLQRDTARSFAATLAHPPATPVVIAFAAIAGVLVFTDQIAAAQA
jgi:hypothetical protein